MPQPLWVVSCPHACPRVADEPLDAPLQHRHVVGCGKVHDLTDSLGREVAVGYDAAAELMERGHTRLLTLLRTRLRTLLRRAGTRSSTIGYEIARIAHCEAFWRVDHAARSVSVCARFRARARPAAVAWPSKRDTARKGANRGRLSVVPQKRKAECVMCHVKSLWCQCGLFLSHRTRPHTCSTKRRNAGQLLVAENERGVHAWRTKSDSMGFMGAAAGATARS